jgi:uncharacterized protein YndB with AHSA1/START domain
MKELVLLEAVYPEPPERVWQALTDPKALSQWLMPTDFQPLIGFRFRLDRPAGQKGVKGKVLEVEPGKLLTFTWDDEDDPGKPALVVWSLQPDGTGTKLRVEHRQIEEPVVNCISTYFNWRWALKKGLPFALRMLAQPVPIVYVQEEAIAK